MLKKFESAIALSLLMLVSHSAFSDARTQAKRIHDRLTGTAPTDSVLDQMETAIGSDPTGRSAAEIAMLDPAFYNVTLKNFASPWTNEEESVFEPLNDYSATVIGLIRDGDIGADFRELLYGNVIYIGSNSLSISNYSNINNNHYVELEASNVPLGPTTSNLVQQTQSSVTGHPATATAGVMTTRAAAKSFFYLGTNRAMFRFTMLNHLCTDLEPIKDNTRPADHVRQDVSRSPGGDSRIYMNSCLSCHAGMDGMVGAFAYYELGYNGDKDTANAEFEASANMLYTEGSVFPKHLINAANFKPGHITVDDSWINYWRNGPNELMWQGVSYPGMVLDDRGHAIGNGAKSLGMELANSNAFASCQVKKAFQAVCLRDPDDYAADRAEVNNIVSDFEVGYNMKNVFRDVAAYCKGN